MILLFIHVLVAVLGLGLACGFPILLKTAHSSDQATSTFQLMNQLKQMPKLASLVLILTGVGMAVVKPEMYTKGWFAASLIIYVITQFFAMRVLPDMLKKQNSLLSYLHDEELPRPNPAVSGKKLKLEGILHLSAVILLTLMVFQPF